MRQAAEPNFGQKNGQTSLYLEVQYDPDCDDTYEEVFSPRKRLGAVPAAFEAKQLAGYTWASPDAIGSTTPASGAFTTLSATGAFTTSNGSILSSAAGVLLDFETTSNEIAFGSATGITDLDFGSFNLTTTGTITATTLTDGTLSITGGDLSTTGSGQFDGGLGVNSIPTSNYGVNISNVTRGINYSVEIPSNQVRYGMYNDIYANDGPLGDYTKGYGVYNKITAEATIGGVGIEGRVYGVYNILKTIEGAGSVGGQAYGVYVIDDSTSTCGTQYGLYVDFTAFMLIQEAEFHILAVM